jgi:glycine betaine/proline transport system substrate-binding protein
MKFLRKLVLSAFFISTLSLVGTSANAACKARLGDFDWSSANIHTAISSFILENGY